MKEILLDVINNMDGICKKSLHEPNFIKNEKNYLIDTIDSTYVSSIGKYVDQFENHIKNFTKSDYAIATVNGTCALSISLHALGVDYGDEVFVPSLSFVATANAVSHIGAIPHFIDADLDNLGIDIEKLEIYLKKISKNVNGITINKATGRKIKAIICMHAFGLIGDIEKLKSIADKYALILIEDAAEALGSFYNGKHAGTFGKIGVLSFNGNKIITTGGGGAILTNNKKLATKIRHLCTTAKKNNRYEFVHDEIGFNYRMPNLNAALGCAQFENLANFIGIKRDIHYKYKSLLDKVTGLNLLSESKNTISNFWLSTICIEKKVPLIEICKFLDNYGWSIRRLWKPLNMLKPYLNHPSMDTPNSLYLYSRVLNLPSSPTKEYFNLWMKK